MLQVIRDRAQGFIVWFIVAAIVISFALFGINDYFSGNDKGFHAAVVNGKEVSVYEYQVAYQNERNRMREMFGEQIDLDLMDQQIKTSALERVVDNAVMMQTALDAGFRVSDQQVASQIQAIDAFQEEGKFSKAMYEQALRVSGESTGSFEQRIRRSMLSDQFVMGIAGTSFASPKETEQMYRLSKQQREISYVIVDRNKFKDDIKIADADIEARYDANKDSYMTQEMVSLEYVELTLDSLMNEIEVSEDDLESAYENQKERFIDPIEVKASHILIEVGDDSEAAKAKAQELHDRLVKGEDFAKLAKENSDDPGSAADGGNLGYFGAGIMDKAFEDAAFAMKKGEISTPVRSEFGYHIIKVFDKRGGTGKSFAEVRDQLLNEIKRDRAKRLYVEKVDTLATVTYENPDSLEPAIDELGLVRKTTPMFPRRGGPGIAANRKVADAAFSDVVLEEKLNSELIELDEQSAVVIRVKEHKPAEVRPLAQVRGMIENQLKNEKASEAAKEKAEALLADVKAGKKISDKNYTVFARNWIDRENSEVNGELRSKAFALAKPEGNAGTHGTVAMNNGNYAVMSLYGVKDGDVSKMAAEDKETMSAQLENAAAVLEFTAFLAELKDKAEIERFPGNL